MVSSETLAPVAAEVSSVRSEDIDKIIAQLLPAIKGLGGSVSLVGIDASGIVELQFKGPDRLQKGIQMALLDDKRISAVKFTA
jgi:hypothetical protein